MAVILMYNEGLSPGDAESARAIKCSRLSSLCALASASTDKDVNPSSTRIVSAMRIILDHVGASVPLVR